ncbi:MAG: DUF1405 domain-containing protein [Candidatus Hydrothermarchaeaceae archaeon]
MLINLLGTLFGFLYYRAMLSAAPLWLWVFIPDSPMSTLLFGVSIFLILIGKKRNILSFVSCVYVMKYGFWTIFVILFYPEHFLSPANFYFSILMILLHFGMLVEPLLILHTIEVRKSYLTFSVLWFLLNDYFDYIVGTNPLAGYHFQSMGVVAIVSATSSFVFPFFVGMCDSIRRKINK